MYCYSSSIMQYAGSLSPFAIIRNNRIARHCGMFMAENADVEKSEKPYQLYYFPIPGRAESSRVALSLAKLSWKDNQIDGKEYMQMKNDGLLPWGLVPMLRTPEGILSESSAILRYIGGMAGLTPSDPFQAAKVDEFLDGMEPFSRVLSGTFGIDDVEERANARRAVFDAEGDGTKNLELLQSKIAESATGWAAGTDKMNIADIKIFTELFGLFSGNYDGLDKTILADYPGLLEYHDKVANEPRMVAHYADPLSDSLQWTYQPGAFADLL